MIELFTSETPNGRKIAIMLQEINYEYKIKYVSLGKGDQFKDDFVKISPFSKIPVIIDTENNETIKIATKKNKKVLADMCSK